MIPASLGQLQFLEIRDSSLLEFLFSKKVGKPTFAREFESFLFSLLPLPSDFGVLSLGQASGDGKRIQFKPNGTQDRTEFIGGLLFK